MSEHKTLLQFLLDLLHNQDALADFRQDPQGALHAAGLEHVCVQDIQDLLPVVLEKADPEQCAKYEDDCDNNDCHDEAPRHHEGHRDHHWNNDQGCDDDHHKPHHEHDNEIDKVVTHLNYVTNNYSFDSHDTVFNTNNITKVWADHGSNVDINNETHNVGAGGVDVEGDNNGSLATGGHNVLGNGNELSGDGSTTAFGSGNATSLDHVGTGQGGVISTGSGTVNSSNAFGHGNQVAGANGVNTDASTHDSNNDNSHGSHNSAVDTSSHVDNSHQDNSSDSSTHLDSSDSGNSFSHDDNSVDNSTNVDHGQIDNGLLFAH